MPEFQRKNFAKRCLIRFIELTTKLITVERRCNDGQILRLLNFRSLLNISFPILKIVQDITFKPAKSVAIA